MNTEKKEVKNKFLALDIGASYFDNIPSIVPMGESGSLKEVVTKVVEAVNTSIVEKKAFCKRYTIYASYTSACANYSISVTKEMLKGLYDELMGKRYNSVTICEGKKSNPRRFAIVKVK